MDKITTYQEAIIAILNDHKNSFKKSSFDLQNEIVVDNANFHYQYLWTGWQADRHIFNVLFHIDIIEGKIWVQQDNTEIGVANLLVNKGIQKNDIVLAYFPKEHRKYTEFAME